MSVSFLPEEFQIVELIKLVEQHPLLWNPMHTSHNNKHARIKAWDAVAVKCFAAWGEMTEEERTGAVAEIKNKWKNIKDTYAKDKRKRRTGKGRRKKYIYADILKFLNYPKTMHMPFIEDDPQPKEEPSDINITMYEPKINFVDDEEEEYVPPKRQKDELLSEEEEEAVTDSMNIDSNSSESENGNNVKQPRKRNIIFVDSEVGESYPAECGSKNTPSGMKRTAEDVLRIEDCDSEDPDKMFLLSMLPLFKNLSEQGKIVARIQLTQVLQKLLYPKRC
ncbi:hypothetical protein NQ317_004988 [Molorchus minor]|uniref:MADF domain-containing protein n=1 Tax=Molorchus minor TaxID=1323400 RepID=A0ABQ9K310_9CUCU|nr:hypothetical protein NQ317_004988 [Molorchus minor]